jgi:hypothetical protein
MPPSAAPSYCPDMPQFTCDMASMAAPMPPMTTSAQPETPPAAPMPMSMPMPMDGAAVVQAPADSGLADNAPGAPAAAPDSSMPTPSAASVLLGSQTIQSEVDTDEPGVAEAFVVTANDSGLANQINLYLDKANAATQVVCGIYDDSGSGPGKLLGQATIANPSNGAWNVLPLAPIQVNAGSRYWIAVLAPSGGGKFAVRDVNTGGEQSQTSRQTSLHELPASWAAGEVYPSAPLSAYLSSTP